MKVFLNSILCITCLLGLSACTTTAQNQRYGSPIPVNVILPPANTHN